MCAAGGGGDEEGPLAGDAADGEGVGAVVGEGEGLGGWTGPIAQRVQDMLGLVRLSGYEDRYPGQLSGGQQQRVAIARALVLHPRLMLFDEPLSNLDAKLRVEMRAEIKQLHARLGLTSIYVTHDQAEALSLSDRIVVLREGVLMQVGTPQEIHDGPKNVFVADFMGFRNFLDVTLGTEAGGTIEAGFKGQILRARARDGFRRGEQAVLAIRPEDVRLGKDADGANAVRGKVELVEYLGREQERRFRSRAVRGFGSARSRSSLGETGLRCRRTNSSCCARMRSTWPASAHRHAVNSTS